MTGPVPGAVYLWQVFALALLVTALSRPAVAARWGDYRGQLIRFAGFFVLLGVIPVAIILAAAPGIDRLAGVGLTLGNPGRGLLLVGLASPVVAVLALLSSRRPAFAALYPFARTAGASLPRFAAYEAAYGLFYYVGWELTFRGILFFPLITPLGLLPALAIPTALSTVLHTGHPDSEVWTAAFGGVALGLVAWYSGSVLYPLVIHAGLGIALDTATRRRGRPGAATGR